jgi:peptide/nickel transport system substrate-binding protein
MILQDAAGIPFVWDKTTLVFSKNVNAAADPYVALLDLPFLSLK